MAASLTALLDRVRGSRAVLPHLAALETALGRRGFTALEDASIPVLSKICAQLASLPVAEHDTALQGLQTQLLAVMDRRAHPKRRCLSSFMGDGKVLVEEISHSAFMAAAGGQVDTEPMPLRALDPGQR